MKSNMNGNIWNDSSTLSIQMHAQLAVSSYLLRTLIKKYLFKGKKKQKFHQASVSCYKTVVIQITIGATAIEAGG
jgi:hypothetical protein